jgi:hypothetical protein
MGRWGSIIRRLSLAGAVVAAVFVFCGYSNVAAHPFGNNHGTALNPSAFGGFRINNSNGARATKGTTIHFDVPTSCGPRQTVSLSCTVQGANARPIQVIAQSPSGPANRGDFAAVGVFSGCAGGSCTGPSTAGAFYNQYVYSDGSDQSGYYLVMSTSGANGALEVRSLVDPELGTNKWRKYNNNVLVQSRPGDYYVGFTGYDTESAAIYPAGGPLNQVWTWAGIQRRDQFDVWYDVSEAIQDEPHAPSCFIDTFTPGTGFGTIATYAGAC